MMLNITPESTGCSQTACEIVNETFLSLDGFEALRRQCDDSSYKSVDFAANIARIVDRVLVNANKDKIAPLDRLTTEGD